ncbi:dephospho-CoA kinase [Micromonospora phaseoli]|uniref:Dephospho-CoA kinase n=1 Tax=Micromonospora phaseoli TaxID=1144548 RepID=A0A1H7D928_9ACTN|nr:dephospho-CoA kinase [Micromonospora phaseoli]PZV90891.1 dephospho-CoA kinase [Micromonospora phaseoli]GIJ77439.1 dephospho-CoA kinase [Micromonospora phaseoli]SEJ98248.1 dephospho-CoA kinase [Micromonospora phaseoli]
MLRVGLTGGIGSGKSAAARRLVERGAVLIDADQIAREVVAPGTDGLAEVVAAFSDRVLDADGALDRAALGEIVFADGTARQRLEAIVHARVRARTAELFAAAPPDAVVVNDVPLLAEVGLAPTYHLVVVVSTEVSTRLQRLARDRGMSRAEAERRIAAQADDARRNAVADVLLTNDGTLDQLHGAVDALWHDRLVPFESNVRHRRAVRAVRVTLAEPDPTWPDQYARLAARIRHAVAPADLRVDHIGSTAVAGLAAKDIIDIQLSVPSLADADGQLAERLADAGFPRLPGDWWDSPRPPGGQRWEKRLHGSADPARPIHLHLRVTGSPGWRYALLMRDHLRADPDRRAGYLMLKRGLAASAPDLGTYAMAKDPWFDEEHLRAEAWAASTGWRP